MVERLFMLIGEFKHNIDAKGRIIMPVKLRAGIGERFVATKGLDGCIFVFSIKEWEKFEEKLRTLPISNKDARTFTRFFLAGAFECDLDKQGRFMLSDSLKVFAKLNKEIVIVGMDTRIEIWDKDVWEEKVKSISIDVVTENMEFLGI